MPLMEGGGYVVEGVVVDINTRWLVHEEDQVKTFRVVSKANPGSSDEGRNR
jgi:hypothetical protein